MRALLSARILSSGSTSFNVSNRLHMLHWVLDRHCIWNGTSGDGCCAGCWVESRDCCLDVVHLVPMDKPDARGNTFMTKHVWEFFGPLPICYFRRFWKRRIGSNTFLAIDYEPFDHHDLLIHTPTEEFTSPWTSCGRRHSTVDGFTCAKKCFPASVDPIDTADVQGCWMSYKTCCCCQWSLTSIRRIEKDLVEHTVCSFVGPIPIDGNNIKMKREKPGSNLFFGENKTGSDGTSPLFYFYYGSSCAMASDGTVLSMRCCTC